MLRVTFRAEGRGQRRSMIDKRGILEVCPCALRRQRICPWAAVTVITLQDARTGERADHKFDGRPRSHEARAATRSREPSGCNVAVVPES